MSKVENVQSFQTNTAQEVDKDLQGVLLVNYRPPRSSPLTASLVFGWRALLKIKHIPEQLFDVTLFPVMFTLMFTYLFGGALAGSTEEYLQFLLPGILVQTVMFVTVYTGFGLNTDISKGIFDRIRSLPIWRPSALVGALLGDSVRYTIASIIVIGLGFALGFRPDGSAAGMIMAVLLLLVFAFSISWIWTVLGLILRTPNSVMGVSTMILFPLTFASNIFVDPQTMPPWLQSFVDFNPVTILVTAVRGFMYGTATTWEVLMVLLVSAAFIAVFLPLTMHFYYKRSA